jgi:hypothetical protein
MDICFCVKDLGIFLLPFLFYVLLFFIFYKSPEKALDLWQN